MKKLLTKEDTKKYFLDQKYFEQASFKSVQKPSLEFSLDMPCTRAAAGHETCSWQMQKH